MFTAFLFIVFLTAYAYLFVPANRPVSAVVPVEITEALEPQPPAIAKTITALPDLVITPKELEELTIASEPTPTKQLSDSEPLQAIAPNYTEMGCVQLRQECGKRGIKWRVRVKPGKGPGTYYHLSPDEMREALANWPRVAEMA